MQYDNKQIPDKHGVWL